ncbi:MAG: glucose-1-phosphate cytidylyltransferase [Desulfobacca sp.]|nr:glucose-1-phosphate cytidylyltransferase [Desulfobacca sp.]
MKVVILAGGLGTRMVEVTEVRPKPMVEIGGQPILWHIMKLYAHYGFKEFLIALGYKGDIIKRFFLDYYRLNGSMTINLWNGDALMHHKKVEDWVVHLHDTGARTMTGGRIKRLEPYLKNETFMVTYGDGVSNVNLQELLDFHHLHGRIATVTAVRPPARFGGLIFNGDMVAQFTEKPQIGEGWINGGFLVFEPAIFSYLKGDSDSLEVDLLERLASDGQLAAYRHDQFWQCMDTLRDVALLENLWQKGNPPWQVWS